jgi:hypothetical protein
MKRRPRPSAARTGPPVLRDVPVGEDLPSIPMMVAELLDMRDVLMGRVPPPVDMGVLGLQEYADAYFARASEMTMLIQQGEREGTISRSSGYYKFRTGELRTFMELAKRAADLGSRRVTAARLEFDQEMKGRESG